MNITRKDIGYTVYSRLEEALRNWIAMTLLGFGDQWLEHIPPGILDKAIDRSTFASSEELTDPSDMLDETDMPDLAEIVCYRSAFSTFVPHGSFTQREFQDHIASLYELRNKIAHVKKSFTAIELDMLIDIADRFLEILTIQGDELRETLKCIKSNPESVVIRIPNDFLFG